MNEISTYIQKTKIIIIFEVILVFFTIIFYLLLKNVLIGIYFGLFIISLFIWIILLLLTANLYNKAKRKMRENLNEQ
jgi:hypothetical protein